MSVTQFQLKVVGEGGKVRARGNLATVVAQAVNLVSTTSYVATISVATDAPMGTLSFRGRRNNVIDIDYMKNTNHPDQSTPAWLAQVPSMSASLGKQASWVTPP